VFHDRFQHVVIGTEVVFDCILGYTLLTLSESVLPILRKIMGRYFGSRPYVYRLPDYSNY
jgi:hypothetical protein